MALMPNKRSTQFATLLLSFLFAASASSAFGQSWQIEQQWQSSCLLQSDHELDARQPTFAHVAREDLLTPAMQQVANQISIGMVQSNLAAGFARVSQQSLVDLHVVVSNSVDDQLTDRDDYWSYYLDCDRWQVTFNAAQPTQETLVTAEAERVARTPFELGFIWLVDMHDEFLDVIESANFATVENMTTATPVVQEEVVIPATEPLQPVAAMLSSIHHPAIDILKGLHHALADKFQYLENLNGLVTQLTVPTNEGS